jgi:hypothetical protein
MWTRVGQGNTELPERGGNAGSGVWERPGPAGVAAEPAARVGSDREQGPAEAAPAAAKPPSPAKIRVVSSLADGTQVLQDGTRVLHGRAVTPGESEGSRSERPGSADELDLDLAGWLAELGDRVLSWARDRSLTASSTAGMALTLAAAAAAWFSAGTRIENIYGSLMLGGCYLCTLAARELVGAQAGWRSVTAASPSRHPAGWSYLPVPVQWLVKMLVRCCDCVVVAGLAAGAAAERWPGMWPLAVAVLALIAIRQLMASCASTAQHQQEGPVSRVLARTMTMSAGGRMLLIGLVAPAFGARAALLGLLGWAIIAIGYAIADELFQLPDEQEVAAAMPAAEAAAQPEPTGIDLLLSLSKPEEEQDGRGAGLARSAPDPDPEQKLPGQSRPGRQHGSAGSADPAVSDERAAKVRWCRDDGAIAIRVGTMLRGNVPPLPPALLGLAGAGLLAMLGLRDLPGILLLTPAIAVLMAAPGASHPHTGRADWLVPAVLLGAQCLYVGTIGVAAGVPGGISFLLVTAIVLRYTDLAATDRPPAPPGHLAFARAGLGWEGRMLIVGLGAAFGIATWADLLLACYLLGTTIWQARSPHRIREGW